MKNDIELKDSFTEYALNELVKKLRELDPEDYESHGEKLDTEDLLDLLLEDEEANGCYYYYTVDSGVVFATYFNDILYICDRFGYADGEPIDLTASSLLLIAMEHAFTALLQYMENVIEIIGLKFDRVGLDLIATTLSETQLDMIKDLILD